jgi:hypothetical protein
MLVVDPRHWLQQDGSLPPSDHRLRHRAIRIAQLIEYGGPLRVGQTRETLVACSKRPERRPCPGLLWVEKTKAHEIFAHCYVCGRDQILIHDWQDTEWAGGPMEPAPAGFLGSGGPHLH